VQLVRDKKKILLISPLPPPAGGIATWTEKILNVGLSDKYEIVLVNTQIIGSRKNFENSKLTIHEINRNVAILFELILMITKKKPALVHLNSSLAPNGILRDAFISIIIKIFKIPLISHYRGNVVDFPKKLNRGLNYKILRFLFSMSNRNIVLNLLSKKHCNSEFNSKNTLIIPNFIEDTILSNKAHFKNKKLKVIYVGAIIKAKGIEDIITLASEHKNIDFECVGDIVDKELYNKYDNLIFTGSLERADVIRKLCESSIFIFPSHSEGFPNAVLEAMAVGLPIIGSNAGAIPEMVDDGLGGYVFEGKNLKECKKAFNNIIYDKEKLMVMGNYNRNKVVNNYTHKKVVGQLCKLYDEAISDF